MQITRRSVRCNVFNLAGIFTHFADVTNGISVSIRQLYRHDFGQRPKGLFVCWAFWTS